ncbi:MAG: hypothetical protein CO105_13720 [Comamonadaceae bacterium CG_4_9_14_3_um_filter_60_33]|nr:MAG: hypothetical protein AUK51_07150 [Comamonadaceae bacterium CG2_30_59_20]PIY27728.1 MAG: hypothetical protein COZ09_13720 [Comamonadaceae bacterium CG_4_10_14_3_um_filter_60_42]PJB41438.1 MAG: hypothetical protein CO105_13720 [Comamonadaceae bacterium CG_4_9_14_3_um_filter_60_33]
MLLIPQILVRAFALGASAALIACGQQGPLYLPPDAAPQQVPQPEPVLPASGNTQNILQPANSASAPHYQ